MYGLKIAGRDQVSFGPVPVLMEVKIIWSPVVVVYAYLKIFIDLFPIGFWPCGLAENCNRTSFKMRQKKCVVQVTRHTQTFYLPTLNFFLQILKLEENSGGGGGGGGGTSVKLFLFSIC